MSSLSVPEQEIDPRNGHTPQAKGRAADASGDFAAGKSKTPEKSVPVRNVRACVHQHRGTLRPLKFSSPSEKITQTHASQATTSKLIKKSQTPPPLSALHTPTKESSKIVVKEPSTAPPATKFKSKLFTKASPSKTPAISHVSTLRLNAILSFRTMKSVTQFDFKSSSPNSCMRSRSPTSTFSQASFSKASYFEKDFYYVLHEPDPRLAGIKVFAIVMLNAWRKRREDVKRLAEQIEDLNRASIKSKNQVHVLNTLFRVEQKRNDQLSCQLKKSQEDIKFNKSSYEDLTASLISIQTDKVLLEEQLEMKNKEIEDVSTILGQTKSELFQMMARHRRLNAAMTVEQRRILYLTDQNNKLIKDLDELNMSATKKEECLLMLIARKQSSLKEALGRIMEMELEYERLEQAVITLQATAEDMFKMKREIAQLKVEIKNLRTQLATTLTNRLRTHWRNSLFYQRITFRVLHWIAYVILPATPAPELPIYPINFIWAKAMSVVKR